MKSFKQRFAMLVASVVFAAEQFVDGARNALRQPNVLSANVELGTGTHERAISKIPDATITVRHLLYKKGSDNDHVAVLSAASDFPLGTIADESPGVSVMSDEPTSSLAVLLLGKGPSKRMVASGRGTALAVGDEVFADTGGKVRARPVSSGTYWMVGYVIDHAPSAEDDVLEVSDTSPVKLVI